MKKQVLAVLLLLGCAACSQPVEENVPPYREVDRLIAERDFEHAIPMLEAMRPARGDEPAVIGRLERAYAEQKDLSKSIKTLREGIEKHPDSGDLRVLVAMRYLELDQQQLALAEFEKARTLGVGDKQLALPMGMCLGRMGELERAEQEFARALAAGSEARVVRYNQALVLTQRNRLNEAKDVLEEVLIADPKWAPAQRELARVMLLLYPQNREAIDRAMAMLWDAKDRLPDDWYVQEVMGDGWLLLGDYDAALQCYTEALRLGKNPKVVEDKYRTAARAQKAALAAKSEAAKDAPSETPK